MQDLERRDPAERDWPGGPPDEAGPDPEVSTEHPPPRRWSAEQKAQIVRESFWPGNRVSDVAQRYGLNRKQLSAWRALARKGKLVLPSSTGPEAKPVAVATEPEREPAFATLEVDPAPEPDRGSLGSVSIEARGVRDARREPARQLSAARNGSCTVWRRWREAPVRAPGPGSR